MEVSPTILVTGASEMLAYSIVKKLISKGEKIRVLLNEKSETFHLKSLKFIEIIYGNLLDIVALENAMNGINEIFHCEEYISFSPKDKIKLYDINILGTRNIVNVALSSDVKKILYVSSTLAFGTYSFKNKINEKTKWADNNDNTYYSITKHNAELEIHRAQAEGLETIIVNPSLMIGKSLNKNAMYNLFNIVNSNYSFCPNGINGFVKIEDVASICIQLMENNISDEKFIISADNLNYKSVFKIINPSYGKNINTKSEFTLKLAWKINWLKSIFFGSRPFFSKEIYNFNDKDFEFDNKKIIQFLEYEFSKL